MAHLAYNAGRIATYTFLGAIAGATGGLVSTAFERGASLVAGTAMILAALLMWGRIASRWPISNRPSLITIKSANLLKSPSPATKLPLGLLLGFMPCGLIYAALLKAVDTGSALNGAQTMLLFGLGTSGALLAIGLFSSAITARFGRYANTFATISVMLLGILLIARGLGGHHHHA
jgi:sulfite exporter TauE/SafE